MDIKRIAKNAAKIYIFISICTLIILLLLIKLTPFIIDRLL
jgi:hypothetical protein